MASWPGRVPTGTVSHALSSTLDLLPTLLALAGVALPQDRRFDGPDMAPVLFGGAATLHDSLLFR